MSLRRLLVFGGWYGSGNLGDEAILMRAHRRDPIYDYGFLSRTIHWGPASVYGSPVFLFGAGAKKVKSFMGRIITKRLMNIPKIISVRDKFSYRVLEEFTRNTIRLTGDSALFIPFKTRGNKEKKAVVCPRSLSLYHRSSYHDFLTSEQISKIKRVTAKTCDRLVSEGFTVVFVPFHVTSSDDDRKEISDILRLMKNKDVEVLSRPGSPEEFLVMLESSSLVYGMRLHSLVLSALAKVPFLSIGYDSKIFGFMNLTGMDAYLGLLGDDVFSYYEKIDKILQDQEKLQVQLESKVNNIKKRIIDEAEMISSFLSS